jgi:two-component system, OmpR family, sensor kinase
MFSRIRNRLRPRSVRARLTFWYLLTLGGSLLAFAAFVFVVRAGTLYREMDADLKIRAHQIAAELRPVVYALDVEQALAHDERAIAAPLLVRAVPGSILFESPRFPRLVWNGDRHLATAARDGTALVTVATLGGSPVRVATVRIDRPGAEALALQVADPTEPVRQTLRQLAIVMAMAIIVVLAVASYGSGITARRALAPVDQIVARVRHIQAARVSDRLDVQAGSEELDRLVATLNEMLDRLEASMRSARRFAADASHELQSPLAAMRGIVENCVRRERSLAEYRAMATDLLAEIERCSLLVRDLRLLALAEARQIAAAPEPVALETVVQECAEIARALAEEKAIRVETRIVDPPAVPGSALHLRRVLLNLLENAIRYSPPGAAVRLSVARLGSRALIAVQDEGCGIGPEDLPHIFEPFYRADPARARDTGGTGLGLAIADQIVRAHGGEMTVTSVPSSGSRFTVSLPLAQPAEEGPISFR